MAKDDSDQWMSSTETAQINTLSITTDEIAGCMENYIDYTSDPYKKNKLLLKKIEENITPNINLKLI